MPHIHIHRHPYPWKRALPHFDVRMCEECGALVYKQNGQNQHSEYHTHLRQLILEFAKRTGMTEEQIEMPWTWDINTTVLDRTEELEAAP